MSVVSIEEEIRSFIADELLEAPAIDGDPLEEGLLDSLALEQLISHLESRFQIDVGEGELTEDDVGSVAALAAFLRRKVARSA